MHTQASAARSTIVQRYSPRNILAHCAKIHKPENCPILLNSPRVTATAAAAAPAAGGVCELGEKHVGDAAIAAAAAPAAAAAAAAFLRRMKIESFPGFQIAVEVVVGVVVVLAEAVVVVVVVVVLIVGVVG